MSQSRSMWSKLAKPKQSCFWMPRLPKATDSSRQLRLQSSEEQWLKQYTAKPNLGMKLNSYKFCDHLWSSITDDQLLSVMKYFVWFFYFDDQFDFHFDNTTCIRQRDQILRSVLLGNACDSSEGEENADNVNMFRSIVGDIINLENPEACHQFYSDLKWYFDSADWMIEMKKMYANQCAATMPFDQYLHHRTGDTGVWATIDFMLAVYDEFNEEGVVKRIYDNPDIKEIRTMSAQHCAMVNDILSLNKDIDERTLAVNGVYILHQQRIGAQSQVDAINDALSLCNKLFVGICGRIEAVKRDTFYSEHKPSLNRFFEVCENTLIQHIQWYYLNSRYQ